MASTSVGLHDASSEKLRSLNDNFGFGIKARHTLGLRNLELQKLVEIYCLLLMVVVVLLVVRITLLLWELASSYNTVSDYRLKENVITTWDATHKIKTTQSCRFNWITIIQIHD